MLGFRQCAFGHRLSNSRGRCVQCQPNLLNRTHRWIDDGFVYLAESKAVKLIKLGVCQDLTKREKTLNGHTWAGTDDWTMRTYHWTIAAGMFEHAVGKRLERFKAVTSYFRYGRATSTKEVYVCSLRTAKNAMVAEVMNSSGIYYRLYD
jgi:hypothetical protein